MTIEAVLVALFFVLPGFVSLRTYEWFVASRSETPLETMSWSIALSLLAAAPYVAIPATRPYMSYLWETPELTPETLIGIALQTATAICIGSGGALLVLRAFKGRLARWSFYQRGWDWLWSMFGADDRCVVVTTDTDRYLGTLAFADEPSAGRDIILRDPAVWIPDQGAFFRSGMKYLLVPGMRVRAVELSEANPPSVQDEPRLATGFIGTDNGEVDDDSEEDELG